MLEHNADQSNAVSVMVLYLLRNRILAYPITMAKLQRYKATLSEVEKRRNLVKRRREHLQEEKGSGFWQGLNDVFQATLNTSNAHGYPSQGYDFVNKRPTPKPKDTLSELLQETNKRVEHVKDNVKYWKRRYENLSQEYLAVKFEDLCEMCYYSVYELQSR